MSSLYANLKLHIFFCQKFYFFPLLLRIFVLVYIYQKLPIICIPDLCHDLDGGGTPKASQGTERESPTAAITESEGLDDHSGGTSINDQ